MKRELLNSSLCLLASGFMLACGGAPEQELAPSAEVLGTREAALDCAGASVSGLGIQGASSYGGVASGGGTWAATYPANAVFLEYYLDGVLKGSEYKMGDSSRTGAWNFNTSPVSCGSHTFEVRAYPAVHDSTTGYGKCTTGSKTASTSITQACPTASLSCTRTSTWAVTCTGSGGGGTGTRTPYWQLTGLSAHDTTEMQFYSWEASSSWSKGYPCEQTSSSFADRLKFEFKVRDESGMESTSRTSYVYCKAGTAVPY